MDTLGKLLGGVARVKLLRLFIFNPENISDKEDISKRMRITPATVTRELGALTRIGVVRKKMFFKEVDRKRGRETVKVKKRVQGYLTDLQFEYFDALREFLIATLPLSREELLKRLRPSGRLRMVIVSGFFLFDWERRLDILIIGEKINETNLAAIVKQLEIEFGRELRYAVLTTEEFRYRYSVQDRLVRDVLDYPHETILDKLGMQ